MKQFKIILVLLLISMLAGCGTTVYQLHNDKCQETTENIIKKISMLLIQKNFNIEQADADLGLLRASTIPSHTFMVGDIQRVWTIQVIDTDDPLSPVRKVIASAKTIIYQKNGFGQTTGSSETYYDDDASRDWDWYWDIRNQLEKICGSKVIIKESKTN